VILLALNTIFLIKLCTEMKKILFFILSTIICVFHADAAVRDSKTTIRGKTNNTITTKQPVRSISNRSATKKTVSARISSPVTVLQSRNSAKTIATRTPTTRTPTQSVLSRTASIKKTKCCWACGNSNW